METKITIDKNVATAVKNFLENQVPVEMSIALLNHLYFYQPKQVINLFHQDFLIGL